MVPGALGHKIPIEGQQATGVVYEQAGRVITARAAAEVILSAGALHSPQLLQRSGIGPGALLARHGIPVLREVPGVGENLMDHIQAGRSYQAASPHSLNRVLASPQSMLAAGLRYYLTRKGPLTLGAALAGGFAATRPGLEAPDVQISFTPFLADPGEPGKLAKGSGFLLSTYQLQPESRGVVRISSPDPHQSGSVRLNYLSTQKDRETVLAGLRLLGRIAQAEPLQRFGATEFSAGLQGGAIDDAQLLAHVVRCGASSYHYSGTARIGTDAMAVVDSSLRVHGVGRLRVIDASVMPTVTSGNTNAATIMIGEKGADLVKAAR